jgi:hypothetical protein
VVTSSLEQDCGADSLTGHKICPYNFTHLALKRNKNFLQTGSRGGRCGCRGKFLRKRRRRRMRRRRRRRREESLPKTDHHISNTFLRPYSL